MLILTAATEKELARYVAYLKGRRANDTRAALSAWLLAFSEVSYNPEDGD